MDDSQRIDELAEAAKILADVIEKLASGMGDFKATGDAQEAREKAEQAR